MDAVVLVAIVALCRGLGVAASVLDLGAPPLTTVEDNNLPSVIDRQPHPTTELVMQVDILRNMLHVLHTACFLSTFTPVCSLPQRYKLVRYFVSEQL